MAKNRASAAAKKGGLPAFVLRGAFVLLLISMMVAYLSDLVTISSKQQELATVQAQLTQQEAENAELQRVLDGDEDEILERMARDVYGYAAPNERVFKDISGK